jgi:multicomponent Na+:H+ antiporter subunit G
MHYIIDYIAYGFMILGCFFALSGSLGLIRMPDFYARIHPSGLLDAAAAPMIILGLILLEGFTLYSLKLVLLVIFIWITSPTATHALAKAAFDSGFTPISRTTEKKKKRK